MLSSTDEQFPGKFYTICKLCSIDKFKESSSGVYDGLSDTYMHIINPPRFPTHFKIKDWHSINGILRNINIAAACWPRKRYSCNFIKSVSLIFFVMSNYV